MGILRGQSGAGSEHTGGREGAEDTASPGLRDPSWAGCRPDPAVPATGWEGLCANVCRGPPSCSGHRELGAEIGSEEVKAIRKGGVTVATSSPQHTHFPKPAPSQRPGEDTVPLGMCCEPMSQPLRDSDPRVALQPHREAGMDWKEGMGSQDPEPSPGHKAHGRRGAGVHLPGHGQESCLGGTLGS